MADDALRTNYTGIAFRGSIHELSVSPLLRELIQRPYYVLVIPGRHGPDVYMQPHHIQKVLKGLPRKGEQPPRSNNKLMVTVVDMRVYRVEIQIADSVLAFSIHVVDPALVAEGPAQDPIAVISDLIRDAPNDYLGSSSPENWARITTDERLLAYRIRVETNYVRQKLETNTAQYQRFDSDGIGVRQSGSGDGLSSLPPGILGYANKFSTPSRLAQTVSRDLASAAIWISGDRGQGQELVEAIKEVLAHYDVFVEEAGPERHGSWWQRFRMKAGKLLASDEAARRLEAVERGISAHLLEKQVAENDNLKADSVSKLMDKLDNIEKAVVILGQLVIVKYEGSLTVKSIDPLTAAKIESSDTLLSDPVEVLRILSRPRGTHVGTALQEQELSGRGGDRPTLPRGPA